MTDKITKLCDSILEKAHEFVGVGNFEAVKQAADALMAISACAQNHQFSPTPSPPADPPVAPSAPLAGDVPRDSANLRDVPESRDMEATIDASLAVAGYEESDWEVIRGQWLTTEQAALFAGCPSDTVRSWCRDKSVLCRLDPLKKRKVWLICPRSIACRVNRITDPRLK